MEAAQPQIGLHLSAQELSRLFASARENPNPDKALRDWALLAFLYGTGLRISEVLNLKLDAVEYEGEALPTAVRITAKGNVERLIHLSATAQPALYQWLKVRRLHLKHDSPWVFVHLNSGVPLPVRTVQAMMQRVGARAGLLKARRTPHKLRHSFATALVNAGRPLEEVQEALGHTDSNVTRRYARLHRSRLKAADAAGRDVDRAHRRRKAPHTSCATPTPRH
ncbi:tyrosine-type recombinase/integrase [Deinococcus sp.]|uniref:tyrosine-type recombinase/integrase n=1 Tax=Deinococcus sp. TaxID=47478 RepID=UPI003B59D38A